MPFKNRIRLPFKLTRPQFPEERTSFRKANGEVKTLSVVIRKLYQGETDYLPEKWHQRLKIALGHDDITYEGEKYVGKVASEGEYTIEWVEFLDYPTAKATFSAQVTPFDATNNNCQSCDEAVQLDLENDTFPNPLEEGNDYEINIATNDSICCNPSVFSVTSFNSDYIDSYDIDQATGLLSITMKTPLVSANGLLLLTYRVTCPNGGYDEANVYGDVDGSIEGCLAPTNLQLTDTGSDELTFAWDAPASIPAGGYDWDIRTTAAPGVIIASGNTALLTVTVSGLTASTQYIFYVNSNCGGTTSNTINTTGTTATADTQACGRYSATYFDADKDNSIPTGFQYYNCANQYVSLNIFNRSTVFFCAAQTAPGVPLGISVPPKVTYTYIELC